MEGTNSEQVAQVDKKAGRWLVDTHGKPVCLKRRGGRVMWCTEARTGLRGEKGGEIVDGM